MWTKHDMSFSKNLCIEVRVHNCFDLKKSRVEGVEHYFAAYLSKFWSTQKKFPSEFMWYSQPSMGVNPTIWLTFWPKNVITRSNECFINYIFFFKTFILVVGLPLIGVKFGDRYSLWSSDFCESKPWRIKSTVLLRITYNLI